MIGVSLRPSASSACADGADPPVHHVARRDDVDAGARLRDRRARQQLERRIVVDDAVGAQHAAVAVVGVLAQAQVGDHEQVRMRPLDRLQPRAARCRPHPTRPSPRRPSARRDPEQQDRRDPERPRLAGLRRPRARSAGRLTPGIASIGCGVLDRLRDEHRMDEVRRRQARLAHKVRGARGSHGAVRMRVCGNDIPLVRISAPLRYAGGVSNIQKRGSYTPRRAREQRAYRLVVTGGVAGTIGVVGLLLSFVGVDRRRDPDHRAHRRGDLRSSCSAA